MVLTAERLKWVVVSALKVTTDAGHELDLRIDSPEYIKRRVEESVWR